MRARFFAAYGEIVGRESLEVPLDTPRPVAEFVRELRARGAPFDRIPQDAAVAVNREVARPDATVRPGDEVAFLPPVAGG